MVAGLVLLIAASVAYRWIPAGAPHRDIPLEPSPEPVPAEI
jgi:hypothetical protein